MTETKPVPVSATHEEAYIAILYSDGKTICRFDVGAALEELERHGLEMRGKHSSPVKKQQMGTE